MVDILMGGNTQMYYLNGRIDYNEIVTSSGSDSGSHHSSLLRSIIKEVVATPDMLYCFHFSFIFLTDASSWLGSHSSPASLET